MRGVIVHGILLIAMLGFAYQTWTRDKSTKVSTGDVAVWDLSVGDLIAVEYEATKPDPTTPSKSTQRSVRIEKRTDHGTFWWGIETRIDQQPKATPPASGSAPTPPETEPKTTKREFPVGDNLRILGQQQPMPLDDLLKDYAAMRAVRSLGTLKDDQKKDFELTAANTTLAVIFKGKTRTLILGAKVSGSSERYALDPDSNKAYILAGALIDPLETGESQLKPSTVHGFEPANLQSVVIAAGGKSKTAARITTTDDKGVSTKTWGDASTQKADQTLANFIDNLDRMIPQKYEPTMKADDMTPVLSATYRDSSGKTIGTLSLFKVERPGDMPEDGTADPTNPPPPVIEYYVITEATRVPAQVPTPSAERAEQDVPTVFVQPATAPAPTTPGGAATPAPAPAPGGAVTPTPPPAGKSATPVPAPAGH
jgi:Domain of unknown function (DUF4340)